MNKKVIIANLAFLCFLFGICGYIFNSRLTEQQEYIKETLNRFSYILNDELCKQQHFVEEKIAEESENFRKIQDNSIAVCQAKAIAGEIFYEYAKQKINLLRKNLDADSNNVLNSVLQIMMQKLFFKNSEFEKCDPIFSERQHIHKTNWNFEYTQITQDYHIDSMWTTPEVFYFHHGLRFADKRINDYIKNKDIIDCGAFVGDSALILRNYTKELYIVMNFLGRIFRHLKI